MAFGYPMLLGLAGRPCLVVGERAVREGKVQAVLDAGANRVTVIAEGAARRLDEFGEDRRVRVERRRGSGVTSGMRSWSSGGRTRTSSVERLAVGSP